MSPPDAVNSRGFEEEGPGAMSSTRRVPAAVPSLTHGSSPELPSLAAK